MFKVKDNRVFIVCIIIVFLIGVFSLIVYKKRENEVQNLDISEFIEEDNFVGNNIDDNNVISNSGDNEKSVESNISESQIYIHIIGEVKYEGIIVLNEGDRVADAIEKAGGVTENADLSKINLAFKLSDGQKVCIPNVNEDLESFIFVYDGSGNGVSTSSDNVSAKGKVNINTATQTELETLTGIGPSIAAKIIEYRKENGNFDSIEELKNVSGIGESKFDGLKEEVVVK